MPLKPQHRIVLMVVAMFLAALLSYTILANIQPSTTENMETEVKKAPVTEAVVAGAPAVLPNVVFYDAEGAQVSLDDFKGRHVLVNLWAVWCPPCVAELPSLDTLQAKLKDSGLQVVAISLDRQPVDDVAAFLAARNVEQLKLYIDTDRQIPLKWVYKGIPSSFLLDPSGNILETYEGPREWHEGAVFDGIKQQLETR